MTESKHPKASMLRHYLPSGAKPFDFTFEKLGDVKFDGFNGRTEHSFLIDNYGFLDYSPETLVKKIVLTLGNKNGRKLDDAEIDSISGSEIESFSRVLLENNRHLWNDFQPSKDGESGEPKKPFIAIPFERKKEESELQYLKRMFDDYNRVNLEAIKNSEDKFRDILKRDNQTLRAIQNNVLNSRELNAQISIGENENWIHQGRELFSRAPSPAEKTNNLLFDLTETMQKMHQLTLSQAKMISSLNEIGIQVSSQTARNIKSGTRFNTITIAIALISMVISTAISISTCHDSKADGDMSRKMQSSVLDQAIKQNENSSRNLSALAKIDSSLQKIGLELKSGKQKLKIGK
jgi:hypothetical protein